MIKLIFFGSPQNAADLLAKLDKDTRFEVVAVATQPDRPIGRKQILTPTPVAQYARTNNIPTLKPPRRPEKKHLLARPEKLEKFIKNLVPKNPDLPNPDLILSYEFGQLIPANILNLARFGGLNIHFSLLPSYRGAAPIPWQIVNGEKETGISVVQMSADFDQGALIYQEKLPVKPNDTSQTLRKRLSARVSATIPDLIARYIQNFPDFSFAPAPRTAEHEPSYAPRLTRRTGFIHWNDFLKAVQGHSPKTALEIERKIRAFSPWPGVWTEINSQLKTKNSKSKLSGKKRLKILQAKLKDKKLIPLQARLEGEKTKSWQDIAASLSIVSFRPIPQR